MHYQNQQRKKFKIKFQVLLKFAQILLDYLPIVHILAVFTVYSTVKSSLKMREAWKTTMLWVKVQNFQNPELLKIKPQNLHHAYKYQQFQVLMVNCLWINLNQIKEAIRICLIQDFGAAFLWKVSLKILNSGMILKTFPHAMCIFLWNHQYFSSLTL